MTLTDKEYKAYLETHLELLYFVGIQNKIYGADLSFKEFRDLDYTVNLECRDTLLSDMKLLDDYLSSNIDRLTEEQIAILNGFKKSITGNFIILKCLANYAIFISVNDNKFYAVKALGSRFDEYIDRFPVLVNATILPFNGQIIYDGFLKITDISFGPGIRFNLNEDYKQAKKKNQIVMTLWEDNLLLTARLQ